ncbi:MAG: hypothetical protein ACM3PT_02760 [Deltaproteobacteria bacterium]
MNSSISNMQNSLTRLLKIASLSVCFFSAISVSATCDPGTGTTVYLTTQADVDNF